MSETPHIVSDVMTRTVVAVGRDAPFKEIVRTMEQWQVSAMPVLEGEGHVIGVVSEADLLPKEEFRDSGPAPVEQRRRLSDIVYRTMVNDAARHMATGPGGQQGNDSDSSAAGSQPHTNSSDKPLPGPVNSKPRTPLPAAS